MKPRLSDYFGAWAIEASHAARLWDLGRGVLANFPAHLAANSERVAKLNGPIKPLLIAGLDGCAIYGDEDEGDFGQLSAKPSSIIAVIDLRGCLMKSVGSMEEGTSSVRARQAIAAAAADPAISAIVLRIDSPGGTVAGTADLADAVTKARLSKPVHAFVEDLCASAAYWVASQCQTITANHGTATIGSIGAVVYFEDQSKAYEMDGVKPHIITTGPLKAAGCSALPFDEAQKAYFQGLLNTSQSFFSAAVAAGRNLPLEKCSPGNPGTLATGQVWRAEEALALGLIDSIRSFDQLLASLGAELAQSPDATQNNPQGTQKMNIFAKMFGVKDDAEAKAKLEEIESTHAKAIGEKDGALAALSAKFEKAAADHAEALAASTQEAEARGALIISGLCSRQLSQAEALAAIKTPSAELAAKLEGKAPSVPLPAPPVKTEAADAESIRAAFAAETDQTKAAAMLRAHPDVLNPKAK